MSTILNSFSRAGNVSGTPAAKSNRPTGQAAASSVGARKLSVLLLAGAVATLAVVADQFMSSLTDEHLFYGWVMLWAVIFAGLALFADVARTAAARTMRTLDGWSQKRAQARAEARMWAIAKSDPRVMAELTLASMRDESDFDTALAPLGLDTMVAEKPAASGWGRFPERLAAARSRNIHLYYI